MMVSVCMITYNHENFIVQALESVLRQTGSFEMEIVIADDGSKDNTPRIISNFAERNPGLMKTILREKNIGAVNNLVDALRKCSGEYIALLEGDDYWEVDDKLSKQIAILENDRSLVLAAHNTDHLLPSGKRYPYNRDPKYQTDSGEGVYQLEDYINNVFFHTSSIVFRRSALPDFPDWYYNVFGGDFFLVYLVALKGKIHYSNRIESVYRINSESISHHFSRMEILDNYLMHLTEYDLLTNKKYSKLIQRKKFALRFGRMYYFPSFGKKLGFAFRNIGNIARMDRSIISKYGRWKIFVPTIFLRGKTNLFTKKLRES